MRSVTLGFRNAGHSEQRRDKRLRQPLYSVRVGDKRYDSINWSLGGILLKDYDGFLFQGLSVVVNIQVKSELIERAEPEAGLTLETLVVRHDIEKRELALKYRRLTSAGLAFFERNLQIHHRPTR